jgi:surface antigen
MVWWTRTRALGLAAGAALIAGLAGPGAATAAPIALIPGPEQGDGAPADTSGALPYLQCVPYARQVSGIQLYGDAHTWWDQAAGRYDRGSIPRTGAVMSFHPYGAMRLGHVAMVSRVIDSRTVLLRHANWSPINGMRGQREDDVRAVDVSDANDWSEVRVWFAPIQDLGTTHWPVDGFIYNRAPARRPGLGTGSPLRLASATVAAPRQTLLMARAPAATRGRIDADFLKGMASESAAPTTTVARRTPAQHLPAQHLPNLRTVPAGMAQTALADDPIGRIIASRMGGAPAGMGRLR